MRPFRLCDKNSYIAPNEQVSEYSYTVFLQIINLHAAFV